MGKAPARKLASRGHSLANIVVCSTQEPTKPFPNASLQRLLQVCRRNRGGITTVRSCGRRLTKVGSHGLNVSLKM